MSWHRIGFLAGILALATLGARGEEDLSQLLQRHWFEAHTAHFSIYSCGETQQVSKLAGRLEQFRQAYSLLAGAQAVASPPIVVIAFPDIATMRPFLPRYDGKPANLLAFFHRDSDENLIVLPLVDSVSLQAVLHEYTHLLMRHNDPYWPLWIKEGMAEIYGSLEITGAHSVRIGKTLPEHLSLLSREPLLPLHDLFNVTHESPEYNERNRQGIFYAQSWLLTHFLMIGDHSARRTAFGQLTTLLRQGQPMEKAFTNAFRVPESLIQKQLQAYAGRAKLEGLDLTVSADLTIPQPLVLRSLPSVEVCFRLGDELLRIGRSEEAKRYFARGAKIAPQSPLPSEGLGLLAADKGASHEAIRLLGEALQRGSTSFLAHYEYAAQQLRVASGSGENSGAINEETADKIKSELEKSLSLMPNFGRAQHMLGLFELIQGQDAAIAEKHLQKAVQLEPENLTYLLSLAQSQLLKNDFVSARKTLDLLRRPYVSENLRARAAQLTKEIEGHTQNQRKQP